MQIKISLNDVLYAELQEVSRATGEVGYSPADWAGELIASELAARRLPRVTPGRNGGRHQGADVGPVEHRLCLPEM